MSLDPSIFVSLALLFGIAAQFRAMDGYSFLRRLVSLLELRVGALYAVVVVTAIISPFVLNDVVILILTPVLVRYAKQFRVDVAPLLVAEITFTNIASSLTPLGNPQNILLWQASGISARQFVAGTWFPLAISAGLAVLALYPFRRGLGGSREFSTPMGSWSPAVYLAVVSAVVFTLDLFGVPNVVALSLAFLLGFGFTLRSPSRVYREFDVGSLLVLCALVGGVAAAAYVAQPFVGPYIAPAAAGEQPYSALFVGLASNAISNVPATQLILQTASISAAAAPKIAVEAGLAGNIDPIGSFANILALVMVKRSGLPVKRAVAYQLVVGVVAFLPAFI